MDLVFLLDHSESVGEANFKKSLDFVDSMIEYFGISAVREGTHVAVIVFANQPKLIFNLESEKVYEKEVAIEELCEFVISYFLYIYFVFFTFIPLNKRDNVQKAHNGSCCIFETPLSFQASTRP